MAIPLHEVVPARKGMTVKDLIQVLLESPLHYEVEIEINDLPATSRDRDIVYAPAVWTRESDGWVTIYT